MKKDRAIYGSFYENYKRILNDSTGWSRFSQRQLTESFDIDNLFSKIEAENFIKTVLFYEGLTELIPKVKFPDSRESHTVSAFFFGIMLQDKLRLSVKSLPRVLGDYHLSFVYFWSMICLSHDLTFWIENKSQEYLSVCKTADEYADYFHFQYNLVNDSAKGELFRNYYNYRVQEHKQIDHGITCGMLLYNYLMCQYHKNRKIKKAGAIIFGDEWKFSRDYKKYILRICETVARHNIWMANPNNVDNYKKHHLHELIPGGEEFKKIKYSEEESMLFLLGLVDTLEPIKCYYKHDNTVNFYDVLNDTFINCNSSNKSIRIKVSDSLPSAILKGWKGLEDWLEVSAEENDDLNGITIRFEYEKEESEESAA